MADAKAPSTLPTTTSTPQPGYLDTTPRRSSIPTGRASTHAFRARERKAEKREDMARLNGAIGRGAIEEKMIFSNRNPTNSIAILIGAHKAYADDEPSIPALDECKCEDDDPLGPSRSRPDESDDLYSSYSHAEDSTSGLTVPFACWALSTPSSSITSSPGLCADGEDRAGVVEQELGAGSGSTSTTTVSSFPMPLDPRFEKLPPTKSLFNTYKMYLRRTTPSRRTRLIGVDDVSRAVWESGFTIALAISCDQDTAHTTNPVPAPAQSTPPSSAWRVASYLNIVDIVGRCSDTFPVLTSATSAIGESTSARGPSPGPYGRANQQQQPRRPDASPVQRAPQSPKRMPSAIIEADDEWPSTKTPMPENEWDTCFSSLLASSKDGPLRKAIPLRTYVLSSHSILQPHCAPSTASFASTFSRILLSYCLVSLLQVAQLVPLQHVDYDLKQRNGASQDPNTVQERRSSSTLTDPNVPPVPSMASVASTSTTPSSNPQKWDRQQKRVDAEQRELIARVEYGEKCLLTLVFSGPPSLGKPRNTRRCPVHGVQTDTRAGGIWPAKAGRYSGPSSAVIKELWCGS
ncbi:hypothetical protein C8F01DRAFT_1087945 [Mycena amicta]|nr:hypothetical protein C8F01DRAFT_1087945 [Mycena amicta]